MKITKASSDNQARLAEEKAKSTIERQQRLIEKMKGQTGKEARLIEKQKKLDYFIENVTDANWILNVSHSFFMDNDDDAMEVYLNPKYYGDHR